MDPISIAFFVGAKLLAKEAAKHAERMYDSHKKAEQDRELRREQEAKKLLQDEANQLGCSVEELPSMKQKIARAAQLGCSVQDIPIREMELKKRVELEKEWALKLEKEKQQWIEDQLKKR